MPLQETFALGGYDGFPGFRFAEQRSDVENVTSWLFEYNIGGPLFLTYENSAAAVANEQLERHSYADPTFIDGNRFGVKLETPVGPVKLELGHNTTGRQQAVFKVGTWQ